MTKTIYVGVAGAEAGAPATSRWVYFGRRGDVRRRLEERLGPSTLPDGADLVDDCATELRAPFVELDRCIAADGRELDWHASTLAERSPYTSNLFYDVCIAVAFVRLLAAGPDSAVFVDAWSLGRELAAQARDHGIEVVGPRSVVGFDARPTVRRAAALLRGVWTRSAFLVELVRRRRFLATLGPPRFDHVEVALVTWAAPDSFDGGERYFGRLPEALRARGLRVGFVANPLSWVHDWREIARAARAAVEPVLLIEDCVRPRDLVRPALRTLFAPLRVTQPFVVGGVDVTRLLEVELLRDQSSARQLWALQHALVGRRLAAHGVRLVIHPFENQAWEKTLRSALKTRGIPAVGYQHTPFSRSWLPYFPSSRDLEQRFLPARVVAIGARWSELFASHGYPREALRLGAALRFTPPRPATRAPSDGLVVAAVASIDEEETRELLRILDEAFAGNSNVDLRIRLHPAFGRDHDLPLMRQIVDTPLDELIASADALVYTGTSACYEALAAGVPVISVRTAVWLDVDPLPWESEARIRVRDSRELQAAVEMLSNESDAQRERRRESAFALARETLVPPTGTPADADPFIEDLVA